MTVTHQPSPRARDGRLTGTASLTAIQIVLLGLGLIGHFTLPGGVARAILVLPTIFWVPGRSLVAALGLQRGKPALLAPLSIVLSIVAVIAGGLSCYLAFGRIPLGVLPLLVSAALLPLNLLEPPRTRPKTQVLLSASRMGLGYGSAVAAAVAILWGIASQLPTTPQQPYLSFALGSPYTTLKGVLPVRAGEVLQIPVSVGGSQATDLPGYSVTALLDGRPTDPPTVVAVEPAGQHAGTAQLTIRAPQQCLHQILLVLSHGGKQTRSINLYVRAGRSDTCGNH